jgi:hypothetical protein
MKNNLFLNPTTKKSNERFNFLELGDIDIKNNSKEKGNKNNTLYQSSDISFKQNKDNFKKNYSNRDSYSNQENSCFYNKSNIKANKQFNILDEEFPVLNFKKDNSIQDNNTSYRDMAATKELDNSVSFENNIEPGHIEISGGPDNKIYLKCGPLTPYQIHINKINLKKELLSQDSNYCMNQSIIFMRNNWDKFRDDYDSVYGKGAYEQTFVYKSEFDSDDENENDSSSEIDSEIDFDNIDSYKDDYTYRDY